MTTSLKDVFDLSVTFLEPLKYITIRFEEIITTHRRQWCKDWLENEVNRGQFH